MYFKEGVLPLLRKLPVSIQLPVDFKTVNVAGYVDNVM